MKRFLSGAVLLGAAAMWPATARADTFFWDSSCTMGSFQLCASVHILTFAEATLGTGEFVSESDPKVGGSRPRPVARDECTPPACDAIVNPEPISMMLLGTGLASMGGLGLLRRRRQNGDVTNG